MAQRSGGRVAHRRPTRMTKAVLADLQAYIAGDRRDALAQRRHLADRAQGCALFADISGFTPLTEALVDELGAQRGAEELTATLNTVFDAVLRELHLFSGSVVFFSGDAVTCWLDGDDGRLGTACALAMQEAMARVCRVTTPAGTKVELAMKVAVAAGPARRFVVGDPEIQLIDVLAGQLMDRLASAEHEAARGEVVVDPLTVPVLEGWAQWRPKHGGSAGPLGVVQNLVVQRPERSEPPSRAVVPEAILRQWLLPTVYERAGAGRGEFLAELRPAVPMFIRFGGIDYDHDPDAHQLLDHFVRRAQTVIDSYGGNLLNLTIGDKGAYAHSVFGCPQAHEDDAARACAAALEILALEGGTAATGLQVGVASGRVRSGAYGHSHRRAYSCLGDPVNLAARLMGAAPPGHAFVSAPVAQAAGNAFVFQDMAALSLKGKAAPVAARRLAGRRATAVYRQARPARPLVGRERELSSVLSLARRAKDGQGQVVALVAEAGMGKSRLVEEAVPILRQQGMATYAGAAASVGGGANYLVWQGVWASLLGVSEGTDVVRTLSQALGQADPALLPRLPLLGTVLGIEIADSELTQSFDAKLRKASLESLLLSYLTERARHEPLVIALEDCHWMGPLSADLLDVIARGVAGLPVLVLVTYRPGSYVAPALAHTTELALEALDEEACSQVLAHRLQELYGPEVAPSPGLRALLLERAGGNPFYLEELVSYLHSEGADVSRPPSSLELPLSLASIVLSRIDALAERPRQTLKVASVVGRQFGTDALRGTYPKLGSAKVVGAHLRRVCSLDLAVHEGGTDYAFKHAIIRDVAYESLPFALRNQLHRRAGAWLEEVSPEALDLLAHHYWFSDQDQKKREYLVRAGEAARRRYANDAAVDYFQRALPLLAGQERWQVLMSLGAVLELRGDWSQAESVFLAAFELGEQMGDGAAQARARTARADPVRKQGRFEAALAELDLAAAAFVAVSDEAGVGRVAHLRGTIAAQRGDYAWAREQYELSLAIRVDLGDAPAEASVLSNLAIVAEYEQDYPRAQELNRQALALRQRIGDRWGIGVSQNNLGMVCHLQGDYDQALHWLGQSLSTELEVGDLWMVAIARHNLGNAHRELGNRADAGQQYAGALATYSITGDLWAQCLLFEDVAMMAATATPGLALELVGAAEAMREHIGSPRVAAQQAEMDKRLGPVQESLGDEADGHLAAGRVLGTQEAVALANRLCLEAE